MGKKNLMMIMMVALVTMLLMILPVSAVTSGKLIAQGSTVFIGEEGLDITSAMGTSVTLGYWSSGADLTNTAPSFTIPVSSRMTSFSVSPVDFSGRTGNWYRINDANVQVGLAFRVEDPSVSLSIMKISDDTNVGGKTVTEGTDLTFDIQTNVILDNKRGDSIVTTSAPIADFATSINPTNGTVTFVAIPSGNSPYYYEWKSGSTVVSTNSTYTDVYSPSRDVTLSMWNDVNSATGDTHSSITKTISTIAPASYSYTLTSAVITSPSNLSEPFSNFDVTGITNDKTVMFSDKSSPVPLKWSWSFGDSTTSTSQNPNHQYTSVGTYVVSLTTNSTTGSGDPVVVGVKSVVTRNIVITASPYTLGSIPSSVASLPVPASSIKTVLNKVGYMDIVVKSYGGATYNSLVGDSGAVTLLNQFIDKNPFTWNGTWDTGAKSGGQRIYQTGAYTVYVECNLNKMKDNYKSGSADYTGKTVSPVNTVTIGTSSVTLTANKDSVVRGKPFSVTITGESNSYYTLNLKGVSSLAIEQLPKVTEFQSGVTPINSTHFTVTTDSSGTRTVGFITTSDTKDQKYTIRVQSDLNTQKYDEVSVSIVKGGMTLVANGDQSYFLGEEIKFSGTNSESDTTYFFLVGPNLNANGVSLSGAGNSVETGDETNFVSADVDEDKFTYDWSTSMADLDSGTYTIYAVSEPVDKSDLNGVAYATASVIIKKPYVSATSKGTVAKGDKILITGVAEGNPSSGVAVWVLGKNYATRHTQSIDSDGTFEYEVVSGDTNTMSSGQYFVVVQHPMQNDQFDIVPDPSNVDMRVTNTFIKNLQLSGAGMTIFQIGGSGSLQGSDAAEALVQAISDPNIDDTYTKLTIFVQEPIISINTIGDKHVGDKFTISGKTNLAVDDEILMEVYSSSFKPTQKTQSGEFSGATGTIKVTAGEAGMNEFAFDVDSSTFKTDEYLVMAQAVVQDTTGSTLFNVVEGASVPVVTPTPVVVTPVVTPVPVVTAIPTVPPTVIPTTVVPTTTAAPGFGAVFALIGLGAVAFIVVRRE